MVGQGRTRRVEEVVASAGTCVVAVLEADEFSLAVDFVCGPLDLGDFLEDRSRSSVFFAGEFPGLTMTAATLQRSRFPTRTAW
jgi:hypothetical protein